MLDTIGEALFYSFLPASLALFVAVLYRLRHLSAERCIVVAFLFSASLAVTLTAAWVGILMRDGLGPDAVSSEGSLALHRSLPLFMVGLLVGLLLASAATLLLRSRRRHKNA